MPVARVRLVSFEVRALVSMGNYENLAFTYREDVELSPGDDVTRVGRVVRNRANAIIEEEVLAAKRDRDRATKGRVSER
jgi:hypothetical protein